MHVLSWLKDTRGATAVEYGMIVFGIASVLIALIFSIGDDLNEIFGKIQAYLE